MERLSVWVSAGLLSAGMSAAVLTGAGVAVADDATSGTESGSSSADTKSDNTKSDDTKPDDTDTAPDAPTDPKPDPGTEVDPETDQTEEPETTPPDDVEAPTDESSSATETKKRKSAVAIEPAREPDLTEVSTLPELQAEPIGETVSVPAPLVTTAQDDTTQRSSASRLAPQSAVSMQVAAEQPATAKASAPFSLIRWVQGVANSVVNGIGSVALTALQALEALVTGKPSVPASSPVTVRTSTIVLRTGQRVQADWYFPDVPAGEEPPKQVILLQHGFLALGPMYSHTAADLAVSTGSIVVTPSLSSNFFGGDDNWLGGDGMAANIADLFTGERTALNDSALAAGYAEAYGLDPADTKLPEKFGLAGHSLGGRLVSAAAGYLVDFGAADDLVGVITLDGVPTGSTMSVALAKLQKYEDETGRYIPIREIGAPSNSFNSVGNIKEALNEARPGRFNGVVLAGGVHMDAMRGGNPLIQFGAFLIAGFPQRQNPPAVSLLSTAWFKEWFAGDTDNGDELPVGSTLPISTPQGTANGLVIKSPALQAVPLAV